MTAGAQKSGGGRENIRVLVRIRPDESGAHNESSGYEGDRYFQSRTGSSNSQRHFGGLSANNSLKSTTNKNDNDVSEGNEGMVPCVKASEGNSLEMRRSDQPPRSFHFDRVFGPLAPQEEIYEAVDPLVASTVQGYNATIFAYGSTGSGKTHTISGDGMNPGIIPRAVNRIFELAGDLAEREADGIVLVHMGYVELYNNHFQDLLHFTGESASSSTLNSTGSFTQSHLQQPKIELHTTKSGSVFLSGSPSLHTPVTSAKEALRLVGLGARNRATGATDCNEHSSRSHAILTFYVESRVPAPDGKGYISKLGKLHIVDLAGSERLSLSRAEGQTLTETQNINLSLSTLGDVLSALSRLCSSGKAADARSRVPYRNSKLTFLLKDSLGGNSKTVMIANIRTPSLYQQQTYMTLMYAERAKKIQNRIHLNTDTEGDSKAAALVAEVDRLKTQLRQREADFEQLSRQIGTEDAAEERHRMEQLSRLARENELEKERLEACLRQVVHNHASKLTVQQEKYSSLQVKLAEYKSVFDKQRVEIETLRNSIREFANGATQDEVEEMKAMVEKLAKALGLARQEALRHGERVQTLERQLQLAHERMQGQSSQQGASQLHIDELREQLKVSRHQYEALKSASVETLRELERMRQAEESRRREIVELKKHLQSAMDKPCTACVSTRAKYDQAIAELHNQVRETLVGKDAQLHESAKERELLRDKLNELDQHKVSVLEAASEAQALAAEMQKQRDEARNQAELAKQQASFLQRQLHDQQTEALKTSTDSQSTLQALQKRMQEVQAELDQESRLALQFKQQVQTLESQAENQEKAQQHQVTVTLQLKQNLAQAKNCIKTLEQQNSARHELETQLSDVRAQLAKQTSANAAAERENEQKAIRLAELDKMLEREQERRSEIESDMHDRQRNLENVVSRLEKELSRTQAEREKRKGDDADKQRKLQEDLDHVHSQLQELQEERDALESNMQGRLQAMEKQTDATLEKMREETEIRVAQEHQKLLAALDEVAKAKQERDIALTRAEEFIQQAKVKSQQRSEQAILSLQKERDEFMNKLNRAEERIAEVEEEMCKVEKDRTDALERAEARANDLDAAYEERAQTLMAERDRLLEHQESLRGDLADKKSTAEKTASELDALQQKYQDAVNESTRLKSQLEEIIANGESKTAKLLSQLHSTKEQMSQHDHEIVELTQEANVQRAALEAAHEDNRSLTQTCNELEQKLKDTSRELGEFRKLQASMQSDKEKAETLQAASIKKLKSLDQALQNAHHERNEALENLGSLSRDLEEVQKNLHQAESKLRNSEELSQSLTSERDDLLQKLKELSRDFQGERNALALAKQNIASLTLDRDSKSTEIDHLKQEISRITQERDKLEHYLNLLKTEQGETEGRSHELSQENYDLKTKLQDVQHDRDNLRVLLADSTRKFEYSQAEIDKLRREQEELRIEIQSVDKERDEHKQAAKVASDSYKKSQAVVEKLTQERDLLQKTNQQATSQSQDQVYKLTKEREVLQVQLKEITHQTEVLEEKLSEALEKNSRLTGVQGTTAQERDDARKQMQNLESRLAQEVARLESAKSQLDTLEEENARLAQERDTAQDHLMQFHTNLEQALKGSSSSIGEQTTPTKSFDNTAASFISPRRAEKRKTETLRSVESLQGNLIHANARVQSLEADQEGALQKVENLEQILNSERSETARKIRDLEEHLDDMKLQNKSLETRLLSASEQSVHLGDKLAQKSDEYQGFHLRHKLEKEELMSSAHAREEGLKHELAALTTSQEKADAEHKQQYAAVMLERDQALAQIKALQNDRANAQRAAEKASATCTRAEETLAKQRAKLEELKATITQLKAENQSLHGELRESRLSEQNQNEIMRASQLQNEGIWHSAINTLGGTTNSQQNPPKTLADAASLVSSLLLQRKAERARLDELSSSCDLLRQTQEKEVLKFHRRENEWKQEKKALMQDHEIALREKEQLSAKLDVQNDWVNDLKGQRDALEESLAKSSREIEKLHKSLQDIDHMKQELSYLRTENVGLQAAHSDRLARSEGTAARLAEERRTDQGRLAQLASKVERAQEIQRNWSQDRLRVKRVLAEAMAGMYGTMEGVVDRLGQKRLSSRIARIAGQVDALRKQQGRSVNMYTWQDKSRPPIAPPRSSTSAIGAMHVMAKERLRGPTSSGTSSQHGLSRSSIHPNHQQHTRSHRSKDASSRARLKQHGQEINSELRAVRQTQEQLLQEVKEQENPQNVINRALMRRSFVRDRSSHQRTTSGNQQSELVESDDSTAHGPSGLGEYKLAVLNACLRGDLEGLGQALSVGFFKSDFDVKFLPLHRMISGYHFHGSSACVVQGLQMLVEKGAPLQACDLAGNTVLHKALQVIPGDAIIAVLDTLINLGADVNAPNKLGDSPLLTELRRLRSASPKVVRTLVHAGAIVSPSRSSSSPRSENDNSRPVSPIDLVDAILEELGIDAPDAYRDMREFLSQQAH